MTRVLIASLNYAPEETGIAPYSTALAEHLSSRGYRVTVVTGLPHYPAWRIDAAYGADAPLNELRNGVDVRRSRHYVPGSQSALLRGLYEASSLSMALTAAWLPRQDAVLGVVPSLSGGIVARAAATRFGAPYGLIFQDLVGQAAAQSSIGGAAAVSAAARLGEGWAARGAAAVGIVASGFRPYVEALGVDPARIRRVRNWTRTGEANIDRDAMRAWLGWPEDAFVCLHAGNMGHKQGLENVIECARIAAAKDARLLFALMGDGNQRGALEALAARYALPNLRFLPLQGADIYASVLRAADVLLVNQRAAVRDMSLPSKLTSYFAAGRPMVAAAAGDSETAREVSDSSGGFVAAPDDPRALLAAIERVAADAGLAAYLGKRGQAWAREVLSEAAALRSYEQLLAAVLNAGGRGRVMRPVTERGAAAEPNVEERRDRWAA
jgi:glycosyltransferase involved in cell wall biosynthesis